MTSPLRVLLLADTHLGFDDPQRPRVERRRRGPDFFDNYERALAPALRGEVDLVVHGGDLLYRSRVRASLVDRALAPLKRVADAGVPVILALGNHERSHLPFPLLGIHPDLHLLDHPRTVELEVRGRKIAICGFPCVRNDIENRFLRLLERTGVEQIEADIRLLCLHQTVEGARVGTADFTFRRAPDVIRGRDLPTGFAAVLTGHIHRHQVLQHDLAGRVLAAPVFYPGSIERTSMAERKETKGYMTLEIEASPQTGEGGRVRSWRFHPLPTRPMVSLELDMDRYSSKRVEHRLRKKLSELDPDSVVQLKLLGRPRLTAGQVRRIAPSTMTIEVRRPG